MAPKNVKKHDSDDSTSDSGPDDVSFLEPFRQKKYLAILCVANHKLQFYKKLAYNLLS